MVVILGLFRAFGSENFANGPALLLTEDTQHLRLDGFLTLIAATPKRLGELMTLTRYHKQMRTDSKMFEMKKATVSWTKMLDLRHTLIQQLLQRTCDVL